MSQPRQAAVSLADWPVAILAGGLATRMRPSTETMPKALLEVAGEPFVLHQLRLLKAAGFRRIVLCLGYLGEQVETYLGRRDDLGLEIDYVFDGPALRGTGGALAHALPKLGSRFVVLYGDSYLPIDYRSLIQAFLDSGQPALMAVFQNEGRWDTSNVLFAAGRIRDYNKRMPAPEMGHIDYGVAVLSAEVFDRFAEEKKFDLADLYHQLVNESVLAGYEAKERFFEIGSPAGLKELDDLLRKNKVIA